MRMFRLPSWISEPRGEKLVDEVAYDKMADAIRSPSATIVADTGLKRKRADSEDVPIELPNGVPDLKRRKTLGLGESLEDEVTESMPLQNGGLSDTELRTAREAIETQFGLEILLKHKELRLINQELAKCQVALEQLRRCHLVPYPTTQATSESKLNVMYGTGPAVAPKWAPPYGVVDGPYTRHYAPFLRPDPRFDGIPIETGVSTRSTQAMVEGRSTRNSSIVDGSTSITKARSSRGSTGHKLQALPHGYPQAKPKSGPCILKRGDGKTVKLVCVDCHREDFSSTQGFINHCRIAHHRDYKSHEEAAVGCGQIIEVNEHGRVVGEEKTNVVNGLVHPLVRNAPPEPDAYRALLSRIDSSLDLFHQGKLPGVKSIPTSKEALTEARANFVPSSDLPHLSNLMRSKGFAGNLGDLASDARVRINLDDVPSLEASEEDMPDTPKASQYRRPLGGLDGADSPPTPRMPSRSTMPSVLNNRTHSISEARKPDFSTSSRSSYPSSVDSTQYRPPPTFINSFSDDQIIDRDVVMHDASNIDLSPNTVSSNNAPSLVSDDGEYDDCSENETSRSEPPDDDSDVAEIDIEDGDVVPRTVLRKQCGSSGEGSVRLRKEDKHVTFVSPMKEGKQMTERR